MFLFPFYHMATRTCRIAYGVTHLRLCYFVAQYFCSPFNCRQCCAWLYFQEIAKGGQLVNVHRLNKNKRFTRSYRECWKTILFAWGPKKLTVKFHAQLSSWEPRLAQKIGSEWMEEADLGDAWLLWSPGAWEKKPGHPSAPYTHSFSSINWRPSGPVNEQKWALGEPTLALCSVPAVCPLAMSFGPHWAGMWINILTLGPFRLPFRVNSTLEKF